MKILIVSQYYYPERFTISDIASQLVKLGHDVSVITGKPNYCYNEIIPEYVNVNYEVINGVKVHRVNLYPRKQTRLSIYRNYLSFYFSAKRFVRKFKEKFDVVLSVSLSPVISIAPAILYAKKQQVPHALYCLDLWPESTVVTGAVKKDSFIYKILYRWSKNLYLKCDQILVSSPSFVSYFHDVLNLKDKPFTYVPQPALLTKEVRKPAQFHKKYNYVYVGNIGQIQLIEELASAAKLLKEEKDIMIHIAGMGALSEQLINYIKEEKLEEVLKYYGPLHLEDTESLYQSADALIVTLKEGGTVGKTIPNKLIHYLKFKKPIIGVLEGDGKDILNATGGAFLAKQTPKDIAETILKMRSLGNEEKVKMGLRNYKYYLKHFSLEVITGQIENQLKSLRKV